MSQRVSRRGVKFVSRFEGFSSKPYNDPAPGGGNCTRGYGELLHYGPCRGDEKPVSERAARKRLRKELNGDYLEAVRSLGLDLKQHEVDALASAVYNLGPGLLTDTTNSTIARRLRSREGHSYHRRREIYREELPKWANAGGHILPGLLARRKAEVRLANHADYSGRP